MLLKLEKITDKIIDFVGLITAFLLVVMIFNVVYDVFARYLFHNSSIAMQELEWHEFAVIMLYGMGYTLRHNGHVRVDFLYDRWSQNKRAVINILGTIFFTIPIILLVVYGSYNFVMDAYTTNEISPNGGLPYRWLIKAQIPFAFLFLLFCVVNFLLHNVNTIRGVHNTKEGASL